MPPYCASLRLNQCYTRRHSLPATWKPKLPGPAAVRQPADPGGCRRLAATFADSKEFLEPANRVSVAIDLALFLRSVGDRAQARAVLEGELWTALDLGDGDANLRKGYVEACSAAGMPLCPGLDILRR